MFCLVSGLISVLNKYKKKKNSAISLTSVNICFILNCLAVSSTFEIDGAFETGLLFSFEM